MKNLYVKARFSRYEFFDMRFGGAGLGNLLFPWARSVIYSRDHSLPRLNSNWSAVKVGPWLRGELDKRSYSRLFKENQISGLRKYLVGLIAHRYKESAAWEVGLSHRPAIIEFSGLAGQMNDLKGEHKFISSELNAIVDPHQAELVRRYEPKGITAHVRYGDFQVDEGEAAARAGSTSTRLPIRWYAELINSIRSSVGETIPVEIFSDARDEELAALLCLESVERVSLGSAIADLLALSKSRVLIASNSTFSAWASYLGRMPVIWFPGTRRWNLYEKNESYEGEFEYGDQVPEEISNLFSTK